MGAKPGKMIEIWDWLMRRKVLVGGFLLLFWLSGVFSYKIFSVCAQDIIEVPSLGESVEIIPKDVSKSVVSMNSSGQNRESETALTDSFEPRPEVGSSSIKSGGTVANKTKSNASQRKAKIAALGVLGVSSTLLLLKYCAVRFWR